MQHTQTQRRRGRRRTAGRAGCRPPTNTSGSPTATPCAATTTTRGAAATCTARTTPRPARPPSRRTSSASACSPCAVARCPSAGTGPPSSRWPLHMPGACPNPRELDAGCSVSSSAGGGQQSVATPQATRGWARPPCRHFKTLSCCCLGSALEVAAFQTRTLVPPQERGRDKPVL